MLGDIPFDPAIMKSFWLSFSKLAIAPMVSDASYQLPNHISMAIDDLIFNHDMHQHRYLSAAINLEQPRQLQIQKFTYSANF